MQSHSVERVMQYGQLHWESVATPYLIHRAVLNSAGSKRCGLHTRVGIEGEVNKLHLPWS